MNNKVKLLYINTLERINELSTDIVELRIDGTSSDNELGDETVEKPVQPKLTLDDKNDVVELNSILDDCYQQIYNIISKVLAEEEKEAEKLASEEQ